MSAGNFRGKIKTRLHILGVGCLPILISAIPCYLISLKICSHAVHDRVIRFRLTNEEYQIMQRFFDTPIKIPMEYQKVEPFPEALIATAQSFQEVWEKGAIEQDTSVLSKLQNQEVLSSDEIKRVHALAVQHETYVQELASLAEIPGYEYEAIIPEDDDEELNYTLLTTLNYHILLVAYHHDMIGQNGLALSQALNAIKLSAHHPGSHLLIHLLVYHSQCNASTCIANLIQHCNDQIQLKKLLDDFTNVSRKVGFEHPESAHWIDIIGVLRDAKRNGMEVDMASEKPLVYFWRQWLFIISNGDVDEAIRNECGSIYYWIIKLVGGERYLEEISYIISCPKADGVLYRNREAIVAMNLCELTIAQRIAELDSNGAPDRAEIIRVLGHPEPLDPFTKKPYLFHPERKQFYSLGPDEEDNRCTKKCTSSKGKDRFGDIFLPLGHGKRESKKEDEVSNDSSKSDL